MKKALSLILALVLCLSLCACTQNNSALEERISKLEKEVEALKNPQKNCPAEYVGEWKTKNGLYDITYVLKLNADGTGSYEEDGEYTDVIWEYNEKYNTIAFELTYYNSTGSFEIGEKDGKIFLGETEHHNFPDIFYRSADFEE